LEEKPPLKHEQQQQRQQPIDLEHISTVRKMLYGDEGRSEIKFIDLSSSYSM
jgi:hypothetical protein